MFAKLAVIASIAVVALAQRDPNQTGPAITRPLNEDLECGKPFTITWTPTDADKASTVTLEFLKGPAENIIKQNDIAANIPNSGSFIWQVPEGVENSVETAKGYGIRIIVDDTKKFEFSTQFGIKCAGGNGGTTDGTTDYPSPTDTDYSTETETSTYGTNTTDYSTLTTATFEPTYEPSTTVTPIDEPTVPAQSTAEPAAPTNGELSGASNLEATFGLVMGALLVAFAF